MPTKVRKQIYLDQRQNRQLKRLAEARGVSEAQIIRNLLDAQTTAGQNQPLPPDRAAWEAIVAFSRERAQSGITGEPYKWNRDDAYEERESRYGPVITDTHTGEMAPTKTTGAPASQPKPKQPSATRRSHSAKKRRYAASPD